MSYLGGMKQLLCILFFCLLLFVFTQAQKIRTTTLDLTNVEADSKTSIPFCAVQVMDVRFDRSNVGSINQVTKAKASRVKYVQTTASFPDSLHRYLPQLVQKLVAFEKSSNDTLVLLVKQFRISDRIFNSINLQFEPELLLRLSLSAFCRRGDQFTKLFSVDELISKRLPSERIPKEEVMSEYRKETLLAMLQKVLKNKNWQNNGTAFNLPVVQQGIQKRFRLPLFTDSTLHLGVYRNFQEFKQNAPSLINVRLGMKKEEVVSITDSAGKPLDFKNYWGVCSGKKQYIFFRNELCKLIPSDKSFYFLSYTQRSDLAGLPGFGDYAPQTGLLGAALIKAADDKMFRRFFYLNMDDETVYLEEIFGKSTLKQMEKDLLK